MEKDNVLISKQKCCCFIPVKYVTNDYGNVLALLTVFTQEPSEAQRKGEKNSQFGSDIQCKPRALQLTKSRLINHIVMLQLLRCLLW